MSLGEFRGGIEVLGVGVGEPSGGKVRLGHRLIEDRPGSLPVQSMLSQLSQMQTIVLA